MTFLIRLSRLWGPRTYDISNGMSNPAALRDYVNCVTLVAWPDLHQQRPTSTLTWSLTSIVPMPTTSPGQHPSPAFQASSGMPSNWLPSDGVLLHIGPRKTGTTAIQGALRDQRTQLGARGILYPGSGIAQNGAGIALIVRGDERPWDKVVNQVHSWSGRAVVSSENLEWASQEQATRIVSDLGSSSRIVITLRHLSQMVPSLWQQAIRMGGLNVSFSDWVDTFLSGEIPRWHQGRYDRLVQRWADIVGPDRVVVLPIPAGRMEALSRGFENLLDLPRNYLPLHRSNRSLTYQEAEVLRLRNLAAESRGLGPLDDLSGSRMIEMIDARVPLPGEQRIQIPPRSVASIERLQVEITEGIHASNVQVLGDLDDISSLSPSVQTRTSPKEPNELANEADLALRTAADLLLDTQLLALARPNTSDPASRTIQTPPQPSRLRERIKRRAGRWAGVRAPSGEPLA